MHGVSCWVELCKVLFSDNVECSFSEKRDVYEAKGKEWKE